MGNLTPELAQLRDETRDLAKSYGLDFYEVIFELVDHDELNMIASYGGFPTRYPHWRFGMEYEHLTKSYAYGLSKIYELVINNDPCYAYLMRSNSITEQKLVMAHVYGHCDFFKNNYWFSQTNRKMMDQMANHGNRVRRYMDRFGVEEVETFIDACLIEGRHAERTSKRCPQHRHRKRRAGRFADFESCASAMLSPLWPSSLGWILSLIHFGSHHSTGRIGTPCR